jgi:glycine/D-amino acid oxidase-like deaminating enzyme
MWLAATEVEVPRPPSDLSGRFDVVVVGAGLAGLCTAMACVQDGATVLVIDAGPIAGRTTGHSTAKLTALHGLTYHRLARGKGRDTAAAYAAANVAALARLRGWITDMSIDCDLTEPPRSRAPPLQTDSKQSNSNSQPPPRPACRSSSSNEPS